MFLCLKKKFHADVSKHNLNREKQVNFLMIPNGQGREAEAKEKYSIILQYSSIRGITLKNNGDFYCLNCLHFFKTIRALSRTNYFWKSGGNPKLEAPE